MEGTIPCIGRVVVSEADLRRRVGELGAQIAADYAGRPPLLVGVLKGAFVFMSDLAREIRLPVEVDVMAVALLRHWDLDERRRADREGPRHRPHRPPRAHRRGHRRQRAHSVVSPAESPRPPAGEPRGLRAAREGGPADGPISIFATSASRIPPDFVVGYGLDVAERYRNLRDLHVYNGEVTDERGRVR